MMSNLINCKKCRALIETTDARCPMCDTWQNPRLKKQNRIDRSIEGRLSNEGGLSKKGTIILLLGIFLVVAIFLGVRHYRRYIMALPMASIDEIAEVIHLVNPHKTGRSDIYVTDAHIYLLGVHQDVIIFDRNLNYIETIFLGANNNGALSVRDGGIYFVNSFLGVLRYDFETERLEQYNDIQGFYHWHFFSDPFNESRFFALGNFRNLYEIMISDLSRRLVATDVSTMTVTPDYLVIATADGVYIYDEKASVRRTVNLDFTTQRDGSIITNQIVVSGNNLFITDDGNRNLPLYHTTLNGGPVRELANNVRRFFITDNYIMYETSNRLNNEDLFQTHLRNVYVLDFDGNYIRTLLTYEWAYNEDGGYWYGIRIAP